MFSSTAFLGCHTDLTPACPEDTWGGVEGSTLSHTTRLVWTTPSLTWAWTTCCVTPPSPVMTASRRRGRDYWQVTAGLWVLWGPRCVREGGRECEYCDVMWQWDNERCDQQLCTNILLSSRTLHRRASAGGLEGLSHHPLGAELEQQLHNPHHHHHQPPHQLPARRPHSSMSGKMGARSWHPSPFGSDDEEGEHNFFKEEKKNRIKMEIARRRHQIEENARLHEELIRLAKLRENAEVGGEGPHGPHHHPHHNNHHNHHHQRLGLAGYPSEAPSPGREGNSVLRSVDEILRTEQHVGPHGPHRHRRGDHHGHDQPHHGSFNPDHYTSHVYNRVTDFSPVNSDFSAEFLQHGLARGGGGGGMFR